MEIRNWNKVDMIIKQNDPNALEKLKENVGKEAKITMGGNTIPDMVCEGKLVEEDWSDVGQGYKQLIKFFTVDTANAAFQEKGVNKAVVLYDIEILN